MVDLEQLVDGRRLFRAGMSASGTVAELVCLCGTLLRLGLRRKPDLDGRRCARCPECGRSWEYDIMLVLMEVQDETEQ